MTAPYPPLLQAYLAARYRIQTPRGALELTIGALGPVLDPDAAACAWTLISAANPGSWPAHATANAARHRELLALAQWLGVRRLPVLNAAPDGSWREPALALALEPARCDGLARHFGQAATVVVKAGAPVRLRCLRRDWRLVLAAGHVDDALIDWIA